MSARDFRMKRILIGLAALATVAVAAAWHGRHFLRAEFPCMVRRTQVACAEAVSWLAEDGVHQVRCLMRTSSETVEFFSDSLRLAADLYRPASRRANSVGIVLLHGGSVHGRRLPLNQILAERLRKRGYTVLAPDLRGYGDSQDPVDLERPESFDFAADVQAALGFLEADGAVDPGRLVVVGHSFGGGAALAALARDAPIRKLVLVGPPRRITERFLAPGGDTTYMPDRAQREMLLPKRPSFGTWRVVLESIAIEYHLERLAARQDVPLLLLDSEQESAKDLEFLRQIHTRVREPVDYWTLPRTDHYLHTGRLARRPCYNRAVVEPFVERLDEWLRQ